MAQRKDGLDFNAFSIDGSSFLGLLRSFDYAGDIRTVDIRSIADRYQKEKPVGRKNTFTADLMNIDNTDEVMTNLDITVYQVGATDVLGELKGGTFKFTNTDKDGKGVADFDSFANLTGTTFEGSGEFHVTTNASLVLQAATSILPTDFEAAMQITAGSIVFVGSMTVKKCTLKAQIDDLQVYTLEFSGHGAPSTPSDGSSLFGLAFAPGQTAEVTLIADTGGGKFGSAGAMNVAIVSGEIEFRDNSIITERYGFSAQGAISAGNS